MTYERLTERPSDSHGVLIGEDTWAFVVEALLPGSGDSLWGVATWNDGGTGNGIWSEADWTDMTRSVRGITWTRGSEEFGGRPKTGVLSLTVGVDDGNWSPFGGSDTAIYFAPGTIVRVVCIKRGAADWVPQITGLVESWPQQFTHAGYDSTIEITAVETTATLAEINENATATVGSGDTGPLRIQRLITQAEWPFGLYVEQVARFRGVNFYTLQSTDMADNRLTECHLTADSTDLFFCSHRSGIGLLRSADPRTRPGVAWQTGNEWEERAAEVAYPLGVELRPANAGLSCAGPAFDLASTTKFLSVPDSVATSITGDICVIVDVETLGVGTLAAKWGAAGQRSWKLELVAGRYVKWSWSTDGTAISSIEFGPTGYGGSPALPNWTRGKVAVEFNVDTGGGKAVWVWSSVDDGGTWQFRGSATTGGTTSIFNSTAVTILGGSTDAGSGITSRFRQLEVRSGIGAGVTFPTGEGPGGSSVLTILGEDIVGATVAATSFVADTGQTVTINGAGVLSAMSTVLIDGTDPFVVANDLDAMINDVRLAAVSGSQQIAEDDVSIGRWKKRITFARSDLLTDSDAQVLSIAQTILTRRSNVTLRPTSVSILAQPGTSTSNLPALFTLDTGDVCLVTLPDKTTRVRTALSSLTHSVTPMRNDAVWWRATFGFDVFSEAT